MPQFERVVREGKVAGVMSAYNAVNGVPASANGFLLTDLVRNRWGFEGYIVSDCDAIRDIYGEKQHHYLKVRRGSCGSRGEGGVQSVLR